MSDEGVHHIFNELRESVFNHKYSHYVLTEQRGGREEFYCDFSKGELESRNSALCGDFDCERYGVCATRLSEKTLNIKRALNTELAELEDIEYNTVELCEDHKGASSAMLI